MFTKVLMIAVGLSCAAGLNGEIVQANEGEPDLGSASTFWGQSIITRDVGGWPWNKITINFYDQAGNATAGGTLFILTSAYLGSPNALSNATPGFLAASTSIVSNQWVFSPGVTLAASTQYFLYSSANFGISGTFPASSIEGEAYAATSAGSNFQVTPGDLNFLVSGTLTPEPGTAAQLVGGLVGLAAVRRFSRSKRRI
jgi:hypothetical protein